MSTPPLITVVTPNLNQGAYLQRAIDSVLSQGYPSLEYIVIYGGSSDRSVSVLKKFEKHLSHWVSEPDYGQAHAINKSLRLARGEVLTWLNADDRPEAGHRHATTLTSESQPRRVEPGRLGHARRLISTWMS